MSLYFFSESNLDSNFNFFENFGFGTRGNLHYSALLQFTVYTAQHSILPLQKKTLLCQSKWSDPGNHVKYPLVFHIWYLVLDHLIESESMFEFFWEL